MQELVFKVAEAESKDVGRAIIRIDPKDLSKVKAEIGDIVEIRKSTISPISALTFERSFGSILIIALPTSLDSASATLKTNSLMFS